MQQTEIPVPIVKFGVFEVDLRAGELTRLGKRVRLQEQPFQLLAMLLAKPGVLVTREALNLKLGPQTTVDFDHGLNKAVSKIREALGDSADNPRFIENAFARRGYKVSRRCLRWSGTSRLRPKLSLILRPAAEVPGLWTSEPRGSANGLPIASPDTSRSARRIHPPSHPSAHHALPRPGAVCAARRRFSAASFVLVVLLLTVDHTSRLPSPGNPFRRWYFRCKISPCTDMSQDYFADGMTDELITDLSADPPIEGHRTASVVDR